MDAGKGLHLLSGFSSGRERAWRIVVNANVWAWLAGLSSSQCVR